MEILEVSYIARREDCAESTNCQSNQCDSGASTCSAPQSPATRGDVAVAACDAKVAIPTSRLANHNLASGSAYSFVNLPFTANGKFTVSAAEMIVQLSKFTDDEIDSMAKRTSDAELQGIQLTLYARSTLGALCWEILRRNPKRKKSFSLAKWCTSVGIRSPKSAKLWAANFQTVLDTSAALANAVVLAGIDLFLPRVADGLRVLNAELAGREPRTAELPILLAMLKQLMKKPKTPPPSNKHEDGTVRPDPIPINNDPYSDEALVEIAESEEEVRLYVAAAIKHLALYDPLLRTYIALPADATVEDRAQKLFGFTPAHERELFGEVWSESCRQAAEREAHFQSEHQMDAGQGEPIPNLTAVSEAPEPAALPTLS